MTAPPTCNCGPTCTWPGCELTCEGRERMDKVHQAERMAAATAATSEVQAVLDMHSQCRPGSSLDIMIRAYIAIYAKLESARTRALGAEVDRDEARRMEQQLRDLLQRSQEEGQQLLANVETLSAQLAAAVGALREWCIAPWYTLESKGLSCSQCEHSWNDGNPEIHKADCIAAFAQGKGAQEHG